VPSVPCHTHIIRNVTVEKHSNYTCRDISVKQEPEQFTVINPVECFSGVKKRAVDRALVSDIVGQGFF